MIKNIVFAAFVFTAFVQAMEQENKENRWSIVAYGTHITLHKYDILEYYADESKKTDVIICLGRNQQREEIGGCNESLSVGVLSEPCQSIWLKPTKESLFYESVRLNNYRRWDRNNIAVVCIGEPQVRREQEGYRYSPNDNMHWVGEKLAVTKSYEDLALCYKTLLNKGMELLEQLKRPTGSKNIAFPMLGADFKYKNSYVSKEDTAPIAVTSIVEFIKNKRGAYNNIEFFVEDDADFRLYKKLLMEKCGLTEKILLFWLAHQKESQSMVALLPRELIDYITRLI